MSINMEQLFNQLYETEYARVFRLCKGYFNGNEPLAQDAAQEVFVKIWENIHTYRNEAKLTTWIYRIAVNVCLMQVRKASYKKEQHTSVLPDRAAEQADEEADLKLKKMYSCIQTLDEVSRSIVLMMLDGVDYSEIADVIGIKEDTLRVKIHRIKQSLTKCVSK
jgi:RNA polymerase sigma factor (sigma-70 family)